MIAVDTNVLVYATQRSVPEHRKAARVLRDLAEGSAAWAIPWPCIHEFLAVSTNTRIYQPAGTVEHALAHVEAWLESPSLTLLAEDGRFFPTLREVSANAHVAGGQVHDARIAALCIYHGVTTLYTCDRDFSRFPRLRVENPLLG
jgi:toxin-antitoxin system PIN domain toxin